MLIVSFCKRNKNGWEIKNSDLKFRLKVSKTDHLEDAIRTGSENFLCYGLMRHAVREGFPCKFWKNKDAQFILGPIGISKTNMMEIGEMGKNFWTTLMPKKGKKGGRWLCHHTRLLIWARLATSIFLVFKVLKKSHFHSINEVIRIKPKNPGFWNSAYGKTWVFP